MASTYISRTPSSASNRKTWTWSAWVKRSSISTGNQVLFEAMQSGGYVEKALQFTSSDKLQYDHDISGSDYTITSSALFRDTNSWYHIVIAKDTTQVTETNRIKVYVNGEQLAMTEEALGYPPQDYQGAINDTYAHHIGANNGVSEVFDGCMSHVHFVDGAALAPTVFGSTDSTTGEWKINTAPSFTLGTNGFTILKDGNTITDQSANSNDFTVSNGSVTKTEDNPSNVFCTMNPLSHKTSWTLTNGNNTFNGATVTDWKHGCGATLGASSGKWYWEVKWTSGDSYSILGVLPIDQYWRCAKGDTGTDVYSKTNSYQLSASSAGDKYNYVASAGSGIQRTINDIFMIAVDFDNKKMWFGENGTWDNSGNPATGANPTWDTSEFPSDWDNGFVPFCQSYKISAVTEFQFNFGNGYFGTTAVATNSGNGYAGAEGSSIFNYQPPTGYSALSTKGLNS